MADATSFQGALQLNVKRVRKAREGEYNPADYLPVSERDIEEMYQELMGYANQVQEPHLRALLKSLFVDDAEFIKGFKFHSAAKTVHHSFVGGLLEHTLNVTKLCEYYVQNYTYLNRDLLYTAAMGHIAMGSEMVAERAHQIPGFPKKLENELKHCILAHHGELEYGSPKKPALAEAMALNLADNTDAKMETMKEIFKAAGTNMGWLGYNRFFESNLRKTEV